MKVFLNSFLFFFICLLLALVFTFPLRLALQWVQLPKDLEIRAVDGSVFSGSLGRVSYRELPLHNVRYSLGWDCLTNLSICVDFSFDEGQVVFEYFPLDKTAGIKQGNLLMPLNTPGLLPQNLLVKPKGDVLIKSVSASVTQDKISDIVVLAEWQKAGIEGEEVNLGDYLIEISRDGDRYRADFSDISGLLEVQGSSIIDAKSRYTMNVSIATRAGTPQTYKNAIELVAKSKKPNQYELRKTGKIPKDLVTYLSFGGT